MSYEDERIVKMTFDNEGFKKGVSETIAALENLEKQLKNMDAGTSDKTFETLTRSASKTEEEMGNLEKSVSKVQASFTMLQIVGMTAISELTRSVMTFGKKLYANTLGQIKSGGAARALNLEAAKFQIEGLGKTWSDVEEDINYGVKDTAYGLDAAAKTASLLLASQVQIGDEMKTALRGISGVAAMTNSTYEDISNIFTDVAGAGRLMGDQLNRLSYRGLNTAAYLKDYFNEVKGIAIESENAMKDFVSKGKVSFKDFAAAMDWAFGEHAKEANKTFTGALANMKAALSRVGEKFVTPLNEMRRLMYTAIIPAINTFKKTIDAVPQLFTGITKEIGLWAQAFFKNENFLKTIYNITVMIDSVIYNIVKALNELNIGLPDPARLAESLEKLTNGIYLTGDSAKKFRAVIKALATGLMMILDIVRALFYAAQPLIKLVFDFLQKIANNTDGARDKFVAFIGTFAEFLRYCAELAVQNVPKVIAAIAKAVSVAFKVFKAGAYVFGALVTAIYNFATNFKKYGQYIVNGAALIANTFVGVYRKVREVLDKIIDHLSDFAGSMQEKATGIKDKILDLFSGNITTATVALDIDIPKINLKDIIQNDAASKIKDVASSMSDYSSASKSAAANSKKVGGIGSGGAIKGSFNKDMVGASAALLTFAKQNEDVQEAVQKTAEAMTKASNDIATAAKDCSEESNKALAGIKFKDDKGDGGIVDSISKTIDKISNKLSDLTKSLREHFSNFWNVLVDTLLIGSAAVSAAIGVVIFRILNSVLDAINVIPTIFEGLTDLSKGFKYSQMADMFSEMVKVLLGFAVVIAVIGVVSKFCDPTAFVEITKSLALLTVAFAALMQAVAVISSIGGIRDLIAKLPGATFSSMITAKFKSIAEVLKAIAILLGAVMGSIITILILHKFVKYDEMIKAALFVSVILAGLGVGLWAIAKALNGKELNHITERTFDLKTMKLKNTVNSAFGGVTMLILSIVPVIAALTVAIAIMARQPFDTLIVSFAGIILALSVVLGGIILLLRNLEKNVVGKVDDARMLAITTTLRGVLTTASLMIASVAGMILTFAASLYIISQVQKTTDNIWELVGILAIAFAMAAVVIASVVLLMNKFSKESKKGKVLSIGNSEIKDTFDGISKVIRSISAYMLSFAASMAIVSLIPRNKIEDCAKILFIALGTMTAAIFLISLAIKDFSHTAKRSQGKNNSDAVLSVKSMDTIGEQISKIVASMSVFMIAVASAASMLSMSDSDKLIPAAIILGGAIVALTGCIWVLSFALRTLSINNKKFGQVQSMFDSDVSTQILKIVAGMSVFVIAISAALAIMANTIPSEDLFKVTGAMLIAIIGITGAIGGILLIINYLIKTTSKYASGSVSKNLMAITASLSIIFGCMVTLMSLIGVLAIIFDSISSDAVAEALITAFTVFGLFMALLVVISALTKSGAVPKVSQLSGLIAITAMLIGVFAMFTIMVSVLQKINWSALTEAIPFIRAFAEATIWLAAALTIAAIGLGYASKALSAGIVGLLGLSAIFVAIGGMAALIGLGVMLISNAISGIVSSVEKLGSMQWDAISYGASQLKNVLTSITEAVGGFSFDIINVAILAISINLIAEALSSLKDIDSDAVYSAAFVLSSFAEALSASMGAVLVALGVAVMFGLIGPLILVGMVSIMIAIALIPLAVQAVANAVAAINAGADTIMSGINAMIDIFVKAFDSFSEKLSVDVIQSHCEWLLWFIVFAAGLALAGVLLFTGVASIIIAALAMSLAGTMLENALNVFAQLGITMTNIEDISALSVLGIFLLISGTLLLTGAAVMVIAAGLLWLSGLALFNGLEYYNQIAVTLDTLGIVSSLAVLGLFMLIAGTVLLAGSAVMVIGAALLYASAFVLSKAIPLLNSAMNTKTITSLMKQFALLTVMGATAVIAGAVLTIAGVLFLAFGATMLIGAVAFMGAMLIFVAGVSLVQSAAESFGKIAENFVSFGEYIVEGLIQGISNMFDDAIEVVGGLADGISEAFCKILKINSPSELFADFGKFICEGLGIGIDENSDKATTEMDSMGNTLADSASTWGDKIKNIFTSAGTNSGGGFASNFVEQFNKGLSTAGKNFSSFTNWFNSSSTLTAGQSLTELQNQRKALEEGEKGKREAAKALRNASGPGYVERQQKAAGLEAEADAMAAERKALQASIDYYAEKEKNQKTTADEYQPPDFETLNKPSSTPSSVPDVTTPEADKELEKAGSGSGASTAMASNVGGNVSNTITTNNNYNFIQNNYSPEPIDRTELYTQTENQHYTWFKWLRDNS